MRQRGQVLDKAADAELAPRAAEGDLDAFEELYRRHVEAAWRMALAVTANPHDAADAVSDAFTRVFQALPDRPQAAHHFLPYLLAAVRNAAIDGLRRGGRQHTTDPGDHPEWATLGAEPGDQLVAEVEATLVSRAFRSLPERWRSVLWLTEVENIPAREVASLLGISANGVAQLAVRARAGLRQRYLQAHLRQTEVRVHCQDTVNRLGAHAAGALAPRDIAKVDQHLAGCDACRSRLAQLQDVTPCLRRSILPLPAALAALSVGKLHLASGGVAAGAGAVGVAAPASVGLGVVAVAVPAPFLATVASAALLVAGFVGVGVVEHQRHRERPARAVTAVAPPVEATFATAGVPPAARAGPGGEAVGQLLDARVLAGDVAALTELVEGLADVAKLPAAAPEALAAIARGDVAVDVGSAAGVDLRDDARACPSFRVLGMSLGCQSAPPTVVVAPAPTGPDGPAGAIARAGSAIVPGDDVLDGLAGGRAPAPAGPGS